MQRLDRLERVTDLLLVLLDTPRPLSLREIADRVPGYPDTHGARRQAFERDKRLLRDEGVPVLVVPIDGDDQLGYRVDPDAYYLPDLGLEPEEQAALNLAVAGVHLGEPIGRDALSKLGAGGDSTLRSATSPLVDLPPMDGLPALPALFDAVRQAAVVRFDYRGQPREVDVAGLRFRTGHWYLVGFDRDRGEARTFRVDRIDGTPEVGAPRLGPAARRVRRRPGLRPRPVAVRLGRGGRGRRARGRGRVGSGRRPSWANEAVVERGDDGAVVVRLSVTDVGALVLWVLDLLDHAEVLRPESVRAAVVERLEASVAAAGSEPDRSTPAPFAPMTVLVETGARLRRLLAILAWLAQVGEAPIDEVAERFDLTPGSLVTELEMAACCGVPPYTPDQLMEIVVTDTSVSIRVGTALARPRRLSPAEGFALATSARALLAVPGSDEDGALSRALAKLDRALGGARRSRWNWTRRPCFPLVREAVAARGRLAVTYYSASTDRVTEREITPLRLFASEGHWYVDAWCATADDVRRFRVDRIGSAEPVEDQVGDAARGPHRRGLPLPCALLDGDADLEPFVPGPDSRRVRISIDPSTAWLIESIPTVHRPPKKKGRIEFEIFVGGDAWLERLLLRLGPDAWVVEPPEYRSLAADAAARLLERYR